MRAYPRKLYTLALLGCLLTFACCDKKPYVADKNRIPMNAAYWYQLNTAGDKTTPETGLQQLTDGNTDKEVFMGWGKLLPTYDAYYEFKYLSKVFITKVRFHDGHKSFANYPFRLYAKASASAPAVLLATCVGEASNRWLDVKLPAPVPAQYLLVSTAGVFPTEVEVCGTYQVGQPAALAPKREVRLRDECGVNSFVWDFLQSNENANIRDRIYEPTMTLMQAFTQYRDYVDWDKLETKPGQFAFNPTMAGGWNYDLVYQRLQREGKEVLPCLKTLPGWFLESYYPADQRDAENTPAPHDANLLKPASYIAQAKLAFQFAARYGRNKGSTRPCYKAC